MIDVGFDLEQAARKLRPKRGGERARHAQRRRARDRHACGCPGIELIGPDSCGPSFELIRLSTEDRPRLPFTVQAQEAEGGRTAYIKASGLSPANSSKNG
jgi:hypothetical protein